MKTSQGGVLRYLEPFIRSDLKRKMVFLSGPRQVGKTTLALQMLKGESSHPGYFNWDYEPDQKRLLHFEFPPRQRLLVFDEIHKYKRWRNWLKGIYDRTKSERSYLITGSARLDLYSRGGDSLTGRYHFYRLHPLSVHELAPQEPSEAVERLLKFGGFPEPFFSRSETVLKRWQRERMTQVLREDIRDLEKIEDLVTIGRMAERLPNLVGAPLSINNLREDLQIAHRTAQKWLNILEKLFVCFSIPPFGAPMIRAVKKEKKTYLWDWSMVPNPGHRFENMVACQLLKYCHFMEDTEGLPMELRYLRDTDKREVDFVVIREGRPEFAVECQLGDEGVKPEIGYFAARTKIPRFYLVHMGKKDFQHGTLPLRVLPFAEFTREQKMP